MILRQRGKKEKVKGDKGKKDVIEGNPTTHNPIHASREKSRAGPGTIKMGFLVTMTMSAVDLITKWVNPARKRISFSLVGLSPNRRGLLFLHRLGGNYSSKDGNADRSDLGCTHDCFRGVRGGILRTKYSVMTKN